MRVGYVMSKKKKLNKRSLDQSQWPKMNSPFNRRFLTTSPRMKGILLANINSGLTDLLKPLLP